VQHFPNLSLIYLSSSIMNITDLNDADLQALDELLNCHRFQAMDPLLHNGARADKAGPKGNLGVNLPDDGALDDVATALLAPPGGPPPLRAVATRVGCHGKTWWRCLNLSPTS
jgi:hypothetical protein